MSKDDAFHHILPEELRSSMNEFQRMYAESLESDSHTMEAAARRIQESAGKQIRPLLLILTAATYGVQSEEVLNGAVFIELLHTATLLHDDVVDMSMERRGKPSLNALYGNKKAVLVGDYILTIAMQRALDTGNRQIISRLTTLAGHLTEGELMQMDQVEMGTVSEEDYFKIIYKKTASLIKASMEIGALLAGEEDPQILKKIGEVATKIGLAFQIRDDIFDYLPTKEMGKPAGADIREHKLTLPLIYALQQDKREAEKAKKILRHTLLTSEQVSYLVDFTIRSGGIEYAEGQIHDLLEEAKALLKETLQPRESLDTLLQLCDYIGKRDK